MLLAYQNKLGKSNVAQVAKPTREQKHYDTFITYQNYDPDDQSRKADALKRLAQAKEQERLKNASIASNQSVEELKKEEYFKPLTQRLDRYFMGDSDRDKDDKIKRGETPIQGVIPTMRTIQDYLKNLANNVEVLRTDAKTNILENLITISDKLEKSNSAVSDAILELADSINNSTHLTNDALKDIEESLNIIRKEIKPSPSDYQSIEYDLKRIENQLLEYGDAYTPEQLDTLLNDVGSVILRIEDFLTVEGLGRKDSELLESMLDNALSLEDSIKNLKNEEEEESDDEVELQQSINKRRYVNLLNRIDDIAGKISKRKTAKTLDKYRDELDEINRELLQIVNEGYPPEDHRIIESIDRMIDTTSFELENRILEVKAKSGGRKKLKDEDDDDKPITRTLTNIENLVIPPNLPKPYIEPQENKQPQNRINENEKVKYATNQILTKLREYSATQPQFDRQKSLHSRDAMENALKALKAEIEDISTKIEKGSDRDRTRKNDMLFLFYQELTEADKAYYGKEIAKTIKDLPIELRKNDTKKIVKILERMAEANPNPELNIIR